MTTLKGSLDPQTQRLSQLPDGPLAPEALAAGVLPGSDLSALQCLVDRDPPLGRELARKLLDQGHKPAFEIASGYRPLRYDNIFGLLDSDPQLVMSLTAPLRLPLLWDAKRARLFACDCAERVLPLFESERPEDRRPREAIEVARAFARGETTSDRLTDACGAACAAYTYRTTYAYAAASAHAAADSDATYAAHYAASNASYSALSAEEERSWQRARLLQYLLGEAEV